MGAARGLEQGRRELEGWAGIARKIEGGRELEQDRRELEGQGESDGKLRAGRNWTRNRAAKAQSWLNQERETEKREVTKGTHGGGMDPRRGGNCDPRGSAHHHGDTCGLHTLPPLLVHDRMGSCLRAPPLLSPASLLDCND